LVLGRVVVSFLGLIKYIIFNSFPLDHYNFRLRKMVIYQSLKGDLGIATPHLATTLFMLPTQIQTNKHQSLLDS
jgi:hypothetical protein